MQLTEEEEVPSFVDNGDGTVSDTRNKLMWAQSDSYAEFKYGINWFEAQDYCESANEKQLAGYDDWRLCSTEEAKMMFSFSKRNTDKDGAEIHIDDIFEEGGGHNTWTYLEKPDYHQYAELFSYVTGNEMWQHKDNEYSHVRLVRDAGEHEDYDKILENDRIDIVGLSGLAPGKQVDCKIRHSDDTEESIKLNHTYSDTQLEWFKKGSFLNLFHSS